MPADIVAGYKHALPEALTLLAETLTARHDEATSQLLLAAVAALKGHPALGDAIDALDFSPDASNQPTDSHLTERPGP